MTNREKLNAMTDQELADLLCSTMEKIADKTTDDNDWCCDLCPVTKICDKKQNGFLRWLEKEAE